jgi:hypothetical protein
MTAWLRSRASVTCAATLALALTGSALAHLETAVAFAGGSATGGTGSNGDSASGSTALVGSTTDLEQVDELMQILLGAPPAGSTPDLTGLVLGRLDRPELLPLRLLLPPRDDDAPSDAPSEEPSEEPVLALPQNLPQVPKQPAPPRELPVPAPDSTRIVLSPVGPLPEACTDPQALLELAGTVLAPPSVTVAPVVVPAPSTGLLGRSSTASADEDETTQDEAADEATTESTDEDDCPVLEPDTRG